MKFTANSVKGEEVRSIYVGDRDRFVVSLIVGYGDGDDVHDPKTAAAAALSLTNDGGQEGTIWHVYDRQTGEVHQFEQHEFEDVHVP